MMLIYNFFQLLVVSYKKETPKIQFLTIEFLGLLYNYIFCSPAVAGLGKSIPPSLHSIQTSVLLLFQFY